MLKFNFSLANAVCCYNFNEITLHKFLYKVFNFKLKYNYSRAELRFFVKKILYLEHWSKTI